MLMAFTRSALAEAGSAFFGWGRSSDLAPNMENPERVTDMPEGTTILLAPNIENATTCVTFSSSSAWRKSISEAPKIAIDRTFFPVPL